MKKMWRWIKVSMCLLGCKLCYLINPNDRVNVLFLSDYKKELKKIWK